MFYPPWHELVIFANLNNLCYVSNHVYFIHVEVYPSGYLMLLCVHLRSVFELAYFLFAVYLEYLVVTVGLEYFCPGYIVCRMGLF